MCFGHQLLSIIGRQKTVSGTGGNNLDGTYNYKKEIDGEIDANCIDGCVYTRDSGPTNSEYCFKSTDLDVNVDEQCDALPAATSATPQTEAGTITAGTSTGSLTTFGGVTTTRKQMTTAGQMTTTGHTTATGQTTTVGQTTTADQTTAGQRTTASQTTTTGQMTTSGQTTTASQTKTAAAPTTTCTSVSYTHLTLPTILRV